MAEEVAKDARLARSGLLLPSQVVKMPSGYDIVEEEENFGMGREKNVGYRCNLWRRRK